MSIVISELVLILASCGRPIRRNSVLEELRVNRLAVIQADIVGEIVSLVAVI